MNKNTKDFIEDSVMHYDAGALALQDGIINSEGQINQKRKQIFSVIQGGKTDILVKPVVNNQDLERFVQLSHKIYANDPYWVGQNDEEEMERFLPETNSSLQYLKIQLFVAEKNNEVVGRICAIINETYNRLWNKNIGFVGFYESINDQNVANGLLNAAEEWIKSQGKDGVYGPFSFTSNDTVGFLIMGFDDIPTYGLAYNPDYYADLFKNAGYNKTKDVVELLGTVKDYIKRLKKLRFKDQEESYSIRHFTMENAKQDSKLIREVFNTSFATHWGFCPIAEDECYDFLTSYYESVPDGCFPIAEHHGQPVGFCLLHDDENRKLHAVKNNYEYKPTRIKAYIIGILPEYQSKKPGMMLVKAIADALSKSTYTEISFSWIVEDNEKSLKLCQGLGGKVNKVYRIFEKNF